MFTALVRAVVCATLAIILVPATGATTPVASATGTPFAPVDRPGPALKVSRAMLAASLTCTADVRNAERAPVLLLAGTGIDSQNNFGWNWEPALTQAGIPWCASDVPDDGAGFDNYADEQTRAAYITFAIRRMHAMADRKVSILGHSQGGSVMRWSLRFWPDTRTMVEDVIGIAPDNHGAAVASVLCAVTCMPAHWQIRPGSTFKAALNSRQETFSGISYTTIRSDFDELVLPHASSKLSGPGRIANLRTQDKCPLNLANHETIGTTDPVAEAIAMDALTHRGPAVLSRIPSSVCAETLMTGVDPATVAVSLAHALAVIAANTLEDPEVRAEPRLRCYVYSARCR
jgi:pimeloyl-ACP methyl ester carboxylesterase